MGTSQRFFCENQSLKIRWLDLISPSSDASYTCPGLNKLGHGRFSFLLKAIVHIRLLQALCYAAIFLPGHFPCISNYRNFFSLNVFICCRMQFAKYWLDSYGLLTSILQHPFTSQIPVFIRNYIK